MKGVIVIMATLSLLLIFTCFSGCAEQGQVGEDKGTVQPTAVQTTAAKTPAAEITSDKEEMAVSWTPDGIISEGEYIDFFRSGDGKFEFYWRSDNEKLYAGMTGDSTGWVSVGFNPTSAMKDADIILGYVEDSVLKIHDMYSIGVYGPHPDDTDMGGEYSILSSGGMERDGKTTVEFSRYLDTGDSYDSELSEGADVKFLWSVADIDDPELKHNVAKGSGSFTIA
jgi:hypothetical protein